MKGKFLELLKKAAKEGKNIDRNSKEYSAKEDILNEIKEVMSEKMMDKMKGLKKITIASDTMDGLKAGLDKAEDVLEESEDMEEESDNGDMLSKLKKIAAEKKA